MKTLTTGDTYEFSDDEKTWELGTLNRISSTVPLTYQSKSVNKTEWFALIREVKPQSVFTKEMQAAGKLPEVGMQCMIKLNESAQPESCKLLATFNDEAWILLYDGHCTHSLKLRARMFSPIDNRTDKEKAIDEIMTDEFIDNGLRARDLIEAAYDKWVGE